MMDFHFAKIYPSYKTSTKFPDTNPAGILRIHIGEYFYALNYFISYSNHTGKHQDMHHACWSYRNCHSYLG